MMDARLKAMEKEEAEEEAAAAEPTDDAVLELALDELQEQADLAQEETEAAPPPGKSGLGLVVVQAILSDDPPLAPAPAPAPMPLEASTDPALALGFEAVAEQDEVS